MLVLRLLSAIGFCLVLAACASPPDGGTVRPEQAERFVKLRGFTYDKNGLFEAVAQRDIAAINGFVSGGFDLNGRDADGRTVLINAAARG
ncbi:MAG TPA: hypothetical protein VF251_00565, partial [Pyrinomonadaceae bacterium]